MVADAKAAPSIAEALRPITTMKDPFANENIASFDSVGSLLIALVLSDLTDFIALDFFARHRLPCEHFPLQGDRPKKLLCISVL